MKRKIDKRTAALVAAIAKAEGAEGYGARLAVGRLFGVSGSAVSHWLARGIPARLHHRIAVYCQDHGITVPKNLFA